MHPLTATDPHPLAQPTSNRLLDVLRRLMEQTAQHTAFSLTSHGFSPIVVHPHSRRMIPSATWEEFQQADILAPTQVREIPMGDPIYAQLETDGESIHHLLWMVGYKFGQGQLLPFVSAHHAYKLTRWPALSTVDMNRSFTKVMSYMSKTAGTPGEISRLTGAPLADVANLLNACMLCGYIQSAGPRESAPAAPADAANDRRGLLGRIRKKLGIARPASETL